MSSKQCPVLFPQTVACSGHGECNTTTGECECDAGWISVGDFALTIGADCDINVLAVQVLWGFAIWFAFMSLPLAYRFFHQKIRIHKARFEDEWLKMFLQDPIVKCELLAVVYCIAAFIVGFLRIIFVEERYIGGDFVVTFFTFLALANLLCAGGGMVSALSKFLLISAQMMPESSRERIRLEGKIIEKFLPIYSIAVVAISTMLFPSVWYPNLVFIFSALCLVGYSLLLLVLGYFLTIRTISPVIDELQKHIQIASEAKAVVHKEALIQVKAFHRKLKIAGYVVVPMVILTSITLAIFGTWPFFLRKGSYSSPITSIFGSICAFVLMLAVTNFQSKQTAEVSNAEESGNSKNSHGMNITPAATARIAV